VANGRPFFDTHVLLYLVGSDAAKADRAETLTAKGGTISVQVLNEFASVASRKHSMPWAQIEEVLATVRSLCRVEPLTVEAHDTALRLARDQASPSMTP
jgi:predicted nucleic acid-binding protein